MARNHDDTRPVTADHDQAGHDQADRERAAQEHLLELGADALPAPPWRPSSVPPSATELTRFAVWRSADLGPDGLVSALSLMSAARAELDGVETGLLFAARSAGLTWAQIADAMGFNSPQACQQHVTRLVARQDSRP